MAELATKPCKYCGRENAVDNTHCKSCKCALMVQPCTVCANPIPLGAEYCNGCKSYQDRRRYFGLSTIVLTILTALISVFTPAINALSNFLTRNSNTMMIVRDADETSVHVYFRDSGRQPSQLAKAQLIFGDLPLLSADLQPVEIGNTLIRPNEPVTIVLRLTGALQRTRTVTDEEILQMIGTKKVKLRCTIAESNNPAHVLPDVDLPDRGAHDLISQGLKTSHD